MTMFVNVSRDVNDCRILLLINAADLAPADASFAYRTMSLLAWMLPCHACCVAIAASGKGTDLQACCSGFCGQKERREAEADRTTPH